VLDIAHVRVVPVVEAVHLVSVWDPPPWRLWTNCYVVVGDEGITLIDCGREAHLGFIVNALAQMGYGPEDVVSLIATHNHSDHIGCAASLPVALRYMSEADLRDLDHGEPLFLPLTGETGCAGDFEYTALGWHTPGSIAVLHRQTGALFLGDHIGFFNDPDEGSVGKGIRLRKRACARVSQWAADAEERRADKLDLWVRGLLRLAGISPVALCPGHGGVLVGDISGFLHSLVRSAERRP